MKRKLLLFAGVSDAFGAALYMVFCCLTWRKGHQGKVRAAP